MKGGIIGDIAPNIIVFGEVKKQIDKKWSKVVSGLIFLTIFLPYFTIAFLPKYIGDTPRWILFSIFVWLLVSLYYMAFFNKFKLFFAFPLVIIGGFYIKIVIYFLKKKYPNTDDPNEIHMFNRKLKIKSIL